VEFSGKHERTSTPSFRRASALRWPNQRRDLDQTNRTRRFRERALGRARPAQVVCSALIGLFTVSCGSGSSSPGTPNSGGSTVTGGSGGMPSSAAIRLRPRLAWQAAVVAQALATRIMPVAVARASRAAVPAATRARQAKAAGLAAAALAQAAWLVVAATAPRARSCATTSSAMPRLPSSRQRGRSRRRWPRSSSTRPSRMRAKMRYTSHRQARRRRAASPKQTRRSFRLPATFTTAG